MNDQAFPGDHVAVEPAADLGDVDFRLAVEDPRFGDLHHAAVAERSFDGPFHDQHVAGRDVAVQADVAPDDRLESIPTIASVT